MRPEIGLSIDITPHDHAALQRVRSLLGELGADHVRVPIRANPGDRRHEDAWYRHVFRTFRPWQILPVLTPVVSVSRTDGNGHSDRRDALAQFVERFLSRHGRWFDEIQLGDELDPTRLALPTSRGLRADDPLIVTAASLHRAAACAQRYHKRTVLAGLRPICCRFIEMLHELGALEHFDVIAAHVFPESDRPTWADGSAFGTFLQVQRRLAGASDRPAWVTATGWPGEDDAAAGAAGQGDAFLESVVAAPFQRVYWRGPTGRSEPGAAPEAPLDRLQRLIAEKRRLERRPEVIAV